MWYSSLYDSTRELLWGWMRATDAQAIAQERASRQLAAPYGAIAVGPGAFDPFVKAATAQEYLSALRRGSNPVQALEAAKAHGRLCVAKHNSQRPNDIHWQRWEGTADAGLEHLHRSLLATLQGVSHG